MDSSDNSDLDFDGFSAENVVLAQARLDELLENASDIEFSDLDDDQYDSDDDIPLARMRDLRGVNNGADIVDDADRWSSELSAVNLEEFTGNPGPVTILDRNQNEMNDTFPELF